MQYNIELLHIIIYFEIFYANSKYFLLPSFCPNLSNFKPFGRFIRLSYHRDLWGLKLHDPRKISMARLLFSKVHLGSDLGLIISTGSGVGVAAPGEPLKLRKKHILRTFLLTLYARGLGIRTVKGVSVFELMCWIPRPSSISELFG